MRERKAAYIGLAGIPIAHAIAHSNCSPHYLSCTPEIVHTHTVIHTVIYFSGYRMGHVMSTWKWAELIFRPRRSVQSV